jgi:hypothetical protein
MKTILIVLIFSFSFVLSAQIENDTEVYRYNQKINYSDVEAQIVYTDRVKNSVHEKNRDSNRYTAPTIALALKWFREEKDYHNAVVLFNGTYISYMGRYQVPRITYVNGEILCLRTTYETFIYEHDFYKFAEAELLDVLLSISEYDK